MKKIIAKTCEHAFANLCLENVILIGCIPLEKFEFAFLFDSQSPSVLIVHVTWLLEDMRFLLFVLYYVIICHT